MKKLQSILFLSFICSISSFAQIHKASCKIDYKLNTHTCGLSSNHSGAKNLQKKWGETILELKQELSSISTKNKKFEIKNDTLHMADKISVKRKAQYNILKFPLQKLVNVKTSFKELKIYTKWKEVVVERYQYKKLKTSQISIIKKLERKKHIKLIDLFKKIKTMNHYREKL